MKKKNLKTCPYCRNKVSLSKMSKTFKVLAKYLLKRDREEFIKVIEKYYLIWMCDSCFSKFKAIPSTNKGLIFEKKLFYKDEHKTCQKCKKTFVFEKEEQVYWYDKLEIPQIATTNNCKPCRKIIKKQKQENIILSDLLRNGEENLTKEELEELISIYTKWEMVERRKYFESKLKKKNNENKNNRSFTKA